MKTRDVLPIADDFDAHDPKGWALGWLFGIADALYWSGEDIPAAWGYRPALALDSMSREDLADESWQHSECLESLDRYWGADGLRYVGTVLDRYLDMFVRGTDHDY